MGVSLKINQGMDKIKKLSGVDNLVVQKSRPLLSLWQSDFSLQELKILDVYLGRINSHDKEHRSVVFRKGELENIFGEVQIKPEILDKRLDHLMKTVKIPDPDGEDGFMRIALFEIAVVKKDNYGMWQVELMCTESAQKYIFNIEELGYLRYRLKCIINMNSRYTYILFLYLWDNKYQGTWKISLDNLKSLLRCNKDFYSEFKYFNQRILKRAKEEIKQAANFEYDYMPMKEGKTVVGIQFTVKSFPELENVETVESDTIEIENLVNANTNGTIEVWKEKLNSFKFSDERIEELEALLAMVPKSKLPDGDSEKDSRNFYMMQKIAKLIRVENDKRVEGGRIRSRFFYLKSLLEKDIVNASAQRQNVPRGTQAFRNFTERTNNNYMEKVMRQYRERL